MRKLLCLLVCVLLLPAMAVSAAEEEEARDISEATTVTAENFPGTEYLFDGDRFKSHPTGPKATLTLENSQGIGALSLVFDWYYGSYTLRDNTTDTRFTAGTQGFLHEFLDLTEIFGGPVTSVTLEFTRGYACICELSVYSPGTPPASVQRWQPPLNGNTDLLLLSTHGDDEQLFFAGLLPYYAGELDLRVQVAYMTDHRNITSVRVHEMLDGLWATGVEHYPVFGPFPDIYSGSLKQAYLIYEQEEIERDDVVEYVIELLRRFRPMAVVGHDVYGEYGHGMHMVYADALMEAVRVSMYPGKHPSSARRYGTWDVPKTYLHLLNRNPIRLDYDQPLDAFGGMTAFQVSQQLGFPCHISQQETQFPAWLYGEEGQITKASQIELYSPCEFGLFRSTVGPDVEKNDFLENLITYTERDRLEKERLELETVMPLLEAHIQDIQDWARLQRQEKERLERERLEQERLEKEQQRLEQERLEKERLEKERLERERLERERLEAEAARSRRRNLWITGSLCGLCGIVLTVSIILIRKSRHKRRSPV